MCVIGATMCSRPERIVEIAERWNLVCCDCLLRHSYYHLTRMLPSAVSRSRAGQHQHRSVGVVCRKVVLLVVIRLVCAEFTRQTSR